MIEWALIKCLNKNPDQGKFFSKVPRPLLDGIDMSM